MAMGCIWYDDLLTVMIASMAAMKSYRITWKVLVDVGAWRGFRGIYI